MTGDMQHPKNPFLLAALLLVLILAPCPGHSLHADENASIRIGVLAYRGKAPTLTRWSATAKYLSAHIGQRFEIVPVDLNEMADAINSGKLQFTLTNPGNYVSSAT